MAGLSQYTSFLKQQREVMDNFRELIRMEKEDLKLTLDGGKEMAIDKSQDKDLKKATENMEELKLFEYFVEVQINAIECASKLTEKFKDKILEMEKRTQEEKNAKAKKEAELRKAEKEQDKLNKAFEAAKAKIDAQSETLGESMFETTDEEIMEEVKVQEEKKTESKPKAKAEEKPKKEETQEESLFDLFS